MIALGKVECGTVKPGMRLSFAPSIINGEVIKIEKNRKAINEAGPGDKIGLSIKDIEEGEIKRGYVASN